MAVPCNIVANADDFGLNINVNNAIHAGINKRYVNSISLLVNMTGFENALSIMADNSVISNVGLHVNLAEGSPVTNVISKRFLTENGEWDLAKTNGKLNFLNRRERSEFYNEICAQINIALKSNIKISHLDSHYHLHTLPCFFNIFIAVAEQFNLKMRLAQTYSESNYFKFAYRTYINNKIKSRNLNFTDYFETAAEFLKNKPKPKGSVTEIMLHPDFDGAGKLTDSVDAPAMAKWMHFCDRYGHS